MSTDIETPATARESAVLIGPLAGIGSEVTAESPIAAMNGDRCGPQLSDGTSAAPTRDEDELAPFAARARDLVRASEVPSEPPERIAPTRPGSPAGRRRPTLGAVGGRR